MKLIYPSLLFATLVLTACGGAPTSSSTKEAWDNVNDPLNLGDGYERNFAKLPLDGSLKATPWSDTYWPSYLGGIAYRWHDDDPNGFKYNPQPAEKVAKMSLAERSKLSPAEKYDIYIGDYTYPLFSSERRRTSPKAPKWEGICHGWAPAALVYSEPKSVLVRSAAGIDLPFGSSDIKALVDLYVGNYARSGSRSLGGRCNIDLKRSPGAANRPECRDVNAGAFHLVLTNFIALKHQGFVADVTRDIEVWNQPVYGFSTKVVRRHRPSAGAALGTVEEVEVTTEMNYTVENDPDWLPVMGTDNQALATAHYHYRLELNKDGEVIGGAWLAWDRPDFLWTQDEAEFGGFFKGLGDIYQASAKAAASYPDPVPRAAEPPH